MVQEGRQKTLKIFILIIQKLTYNRFVLIVSHLLGTIDLLIITIINLQLL